MCICFSVKYWLSEVVHLTCYRICARALSATIRYHNKSVHFIASCRALPVDLNTCFFLQRESTSERRDLRG